MEGISPSLPLPTLVQLGFYAVVGVYALFSIILYYHWNEYSIDAAVSRVTLVLYLGLTVPLLGALGLLTLHLITTLS